MENNIIISEILSFIHSKYGKTPNCTLQLTIAGFYDVDIVCDAKKSLYEIAAEKEYDDVPRNIAFQGDNKKKKEVKDLIAIYEYLGRKRCVLPRSITADLNKIPNVRVADADVCTMMVQMMKMQEDIEQMRSQICWVVKECKEVAEGV